MVASSRRNTAASSPTDGDETRWNAEMRVHVSGELERDAHDVLVECGETGGERDADAYADADAEACHTCCICICICICMSCDGCLICAGDDSDVDVEVCMDMRAVLMRLACGV
jgi:hypothetical protein